MPCHHQPRKFCRHLWHCNLCRVRNFANVSSIIKERNIGEDQIGDEIYFLKSNILSGNQMLCAIQGKVAGEIFLHENGDNSSSCSKSIRMSDAANVSACKIDFYQQLPRLIDRLATLGCVKIMLAQLMLRGSAPWNSTFFQTMGLAPPPFYLRRSHAGQRIINLLLQAKSSHWRHLEAREAWEHR